MDLPQEIVAYVEHQFHAISIEKMQKGLIGNTYLISIPNDKFVLKVIDNNVLFSKSLRSLWIAQLASELSVGPQIKEINLQQKFFIMDYINPTNLKLKQAMQQIKKMHESLPYEPFSTIYSRASKLKNHPLLQEAIKKLREIEKRIKNEDFKIGICHLDFHVDNCISTENETKIIDWDSSSIGHPYYDIAKLTFFEEEDCAYQYFKEYIEREPNDIEKAHFSDMRKIVHLAIATNKLLKKNCEIGEKHLKIFMEQTN